MEAIILAGGFGTRLRNTVSDVPKTMAKVGGRPFLEILLENLESKGFNRVILSLGYLANKITNHFGSRFGSLELVFEIEDSPLGTGGALRASLSRCIGKHAYVFNGDTFLDLEVDQVQALWASRQNPIMVAHKALDMSRYGQLIIEDNRIVGFQSKGKVIGGLINAGCYVLPKDILKMHLPGLQFSLENDFFPEYVLSNPIDLFVSQGYFIDIGIPEDFFRAQKELAYKGKKT